MISKLQIEPNVDCRSYKRSYIHFSADAKELEPRPLEQLISIWKRIRASLLDNKYEETIFVLRTSAKKRRHNEESNLVHIHQFSGSEWESRRFMSILKVVKVLIVNLTFHKVTTLRDIYYQDVTLFLRSQRFSNEIVEMVRKSLDVSLEENLLISASQKGLIYGNCTIHLKTGSTLDLNYSSDPQLIPPISNNPIDGIVEVNPRPDAIVIMEKDAVFKSFCNFIKDTTYSKSLVVITGKGYPDKLTKRFVHSLSFFLPKVPILGFMDSDVYGINIFKNYKYKVENEKTSDIKMILAGAFLLEYKEGWLDISTRDIKMMLSLIREIAVKIEDNRNPDTHRELYKWHRELTRGLFLFKKSEMNVLHANSTAHAYMLRKVNSYI